MTTNHIVQFTTLDDFIADLLAGEVLAIYHDLHEQRVAVAPSYGLSTWQLVTVIRAIVANGPILPITHAATLTIPHGHPVERLNGRLFGPLADDDTEDKRWAAAHKRHAAIIHNLLDRLAQIGLYNTARPGILHLPDDPPLVYAANTLPDEVGPTAGHWPSLIQAAGDAADDYHPGGDGSPD